MNMWQRVPLPWQVVLEEAWNAYCACSLAIGAVVADPVGQIMVRGRNRLFDSLNDGDPAHLRKHVMAHAELNALITLGQEPRDLNQLTLYTTLEPCAMCMGTALVAGIKHVDFLAPDPYGGAGDLPETTPRMQRYGMDVHGPHTDVLGHIAVALLVAQQRRAGPLPALPADIAGPFSGAIVLGETLCLSGTLDRLAADQVAVEQVFTCCCDLMSQSLHVNETEP